MFKGSHNIQSDIPSPQVSKHGTLNYPTLLNLYVPCTILLVLLELTPTHPDSYDGPPLYDVSIEEFETCALDRLRVLAEIESSIARNRSWDDLKTVTNAQCQKYLPLNSEILSRHNDLPAERRKDHLSHFVLRLAFCRSCVDLTAPL
jgi:DNA primase large subunit